MAGDWAQVTAAEFCGSVRDGTHDSPKPVEHGRLLVTSRHIVNGYLDLENAYSISQEDFETISKRSKVDQWDVLISMIGTVGEPCLIRGKPDFAIKNMGLFKSKGEFEGKWLYYFLRSPAMQQIIRERSRGTTQQYIPLGALRELPVLYPLDKRELRAVTNILGTLDDKIELNDRRNETLEAMARALFQDWFVDFGPVLAKVEGRAPYLPMSLWELFPNRIDDEGKPEGWEFSPFGKLLEGSIGGDWGKEQADDDHDQAVCIIRGTDIPEMTAGFTGKVPTRFTTKKKLESRLLQAGDIVVEVSGGSRTQPTGRSLQMTGSMLERFPHPVVCASFCRRFRPKNTSLGILASCHLTNLYRTGGTWEYQNQSTGISNFQTTHFLEAERVLVPSADVLSAFVDFVEPLRAKMTSNEGIYIAQLRDTLLPKLISGELRIKDAERFMGEQTA